MGIVRKEFEFKGAGGGEIFACLWYDSGRKKFKGVLQLAHGMCEHILRYEEFAVFLAKEGFAVCGNDHMGHGRSAESEEDLGYFGERHGWHNLIEDMDYLNRFMKKRYPDIPYILIGHSMGSFLAREYVYEHPKKIDEAIFIGTSGGNIFADFGILLSEIGISLFGKKKKGHIVNKIAFKPFGKKFAPNRTDFDWLSSDESVVDRFIEDEKCGFEFTFEGYRDLFILLKRISRVKWARGIRKNMPILLIAGKDDPVGDYGEGVKKVFFRLKRAGCKDVSLRLYPNTRHEVLNEKVKYKVYRYILKWLNERVA